MRKHPVLTILPALFLLFTFSACDKNSEPKTAADYLKTGVWVLVSASANGTDITSMIPSCVKDNETAFQSGGVGYTLEKTEVCSPSYETTFTWALQNSDTRLTMSAALVPGGSGVFTVVSVNETNLVLSQESSLIPSPTPVTVVATFKHP